MGTVYELVDVKLGEAFDLGKGCWYEIDNRSETNLERLLTSGDWDEWISLVGWWSIGLTKRADVVTEDDWDYVRKVAYELALFCLRAQGRWADLELRNDSEEYRDESHANAVLVRGSLIWTEERRVWPRTIRSRHVCHHCKEYDCVDADCLPDLGSPVRLWELMEVKLDEARSLDLLNSFGWRRVCDHLHRAPPPGPRRHRRKSSHHEQKVILKPRTITDLAEAMGLLIPSSPSKLEADFLRCLSDDLDRSKIAPNAFTSFAVHFWEFDRYDGGPAWCIKHDDCKEHPELGRACWESAR